MDAEIAAIKAADLDEYELRIKPEYLAQPRTRTICTELLSEEDRALLVSCHDTKTEPSIGETKLQEQPPEIAIKLKGQNKKRPPPMKFDISQNICPSLVDVAENEEAKPCPYQPNCKFRHDIDVFMKERPKDIISGGCYNYRTTGRCARGISCLFGDEHITPQGKNKVNTDITTHNKPEYFNFLSKELLYTLRKKKYSFDKACGVVKAVQADKQIQKVVNVSEEVAEPMCKKICLPHSGVVTDEDIVALRPEERKKIDWRGKLYLSPLTTVGNLPFRRLCKMLGADITCGEMAMADSLVDGGKGEWALVRKHSCEDIFGVQICGNNPTVLAKCAQLLQDNTEIDYIDLNLGCPIDQIYRKGAGSGLMRRSGPLEVSIRALSEVLRIPFTVKMRKGVYADKPFAHELVKKCRNWGVSMVTVHGRSREQRYTRLADWDYVSECVKAADPMPIFGNGDIISFEDYERDIEMSGVAGVMIARGALIKPWVFTEIKERRHWDISSGERFQYMKDFVNYGLEHWGSDSKGVERTRRFLLEWQSFAHRYVPVGLLERPPQKINQRPPSFYGRNDLETLLASPSASDWIKICEMLLGPAPEGFQFLPKHKANSWK